MHVGGEPLWDRIGRRQWARLACEAGVAERLVVSEVSSLIEAVTTALGEIDMSSERLRTLRATIATRCARVRAAARPSTSTP